MAAAAAATLTEAVVDAAVGAAAIPAARSITLTAGLIVRNMLNTVNQGAPSGNLLDNRFNESLALANTGGQNVSANRRMEINLRFSF